MNSLTTLLIGALGGAVAAAIQHWFRRYAEAEQTRREIIEKHLLQLQNAAESLYYRVNNLRHWAGKSVMPDEYYVRTSAFVFGQVLAHETLLVSKGIYAKLNRSRAVKRNLKAGVHSLNRCLDDQVFLHYHRVQLAEMLLDGDRVIGFTEFSTRWGDATWTEAVAPIRQFLKTVTPERLDRLGSNAAVLIDVLKKQTRVPTALDLAPRDAV